MNSRADARATPPREHAGQSPEVQLLLCCARSTVGDDVRARMRELLRGPMEWSRLNQLASKHSMLPLLAHHLRGVSEYVPPEQMARLNRFALRHAGLVLERTRELVQVLEAFEREDILAVPYKGLVLAQQLYENLSLRQAGDLDVLVRKSDVARARALLLERGYKHSVALSPANVQFRLARRYCEDYEAPSGIHFELHWAFTNRDIVFPLTLDDVAPRLRTIAVGHFQTKVFAPEDLLQILCVHGAKHRWDRLEWICGISELLRREGCLDWDAVMESAHALRNTRTLLLGVFVAHELLGAPLPAQVLEKARSDRWVRRLAADVESRLDLIALGVDPIEDVLSNNLFQLPLQDGAWDRIRFLFYRFTTPNRAEEWKTFSLGPLSFPVHSIIWPVRLGAKLVKRPFVHLKRRDPRVAQKVVA